MLVLGTRLLIPMLQAQTKNFGRWFPMVIFSRIEGKLYKVDCRVMIWAASDLLDLAGRIFLIVSE